MIKLRVGAWAVGLSALTFLVSSDSAFAQGPPCTPTWQTTFGASPGTAPANSNASDFSVRSIFEFDFGDGLGPVPVGVVRDLFSSPAQVRAFRKGRWVDLGKGIEGGIVEFVAYDSGSGLELYAVGSFSNDPGVSSIIRPNVIRWDGSQWQRLPPMFSQGNCAVVHDDGSGEKLYLGGFRTSTGYTTPFRGVTRWNGTNWESVGTEFQIFSSAFVSDLEVCDLGSGPMLYAAGASLPTDGFSSNQVSVWDGTNWSGLGNLLQPFESTSVTVVVSELQAFDDGTGNALYVGGTFDSTATGTRLSGLACWKNGAWSAVGQGVNYSVAAMTVHDDGSGPALFVGGRFTGVFTGPMSRIGRWDGASWSSLSGGIIPLEGPDQLTPTLFDPLTTAVTQLGSADFGTGRQLVVGGNFEYVGPQLFSPRLALWTGQAWEPMPMRGLDGGVHASVVFDDGTGPALYVAGSFRQSRGVFLNHVAKWNGSRFLPLGGGLDGRIHDLVVFDDGTGPTLYMGRRFQTGNPEWANPLARWDGSAWGPVLDAQGFPLLEGSLMVRDLEVYENGSSRALFMIGRFFDSNGASRRLAHWDGTTFQFVETGPGLLGDLSALHVCDFGQGPVLLIAAHPGVGSGGSPLPEIWRWDGVDWAQLTSPIPTASPFRVSSLECYDSGSGSELYAAGEFDSLNGAPACGIAKWDGATWSAPGTDSSPCSQNPLGEAPLWDSMTVHDAGDGNGPRLHVSSLLKTDTESGVWSFDGTTWSELPGENLGFETRNTGFVDEQTMLRSFDDGSGPALYVGGNFVASESGDSYLARYGGCRPMEIGRPFCFGDGGSSAACTPCPCSNDAPSGTFGGCENSIGTSARLYARGDAIVGMDSLRFEVELATPSAIGILFSAPNQLPTNGSCPPGTGQAIFDGLRCIGGGLFRHGARLSDAAGGMGITQAGWGPPDPPVGGILAFSGFVAGQTRQFQCFYRDDASLGCNSGQNSTNGVSLIFR